MTKRRHWECVVAAMAIVGGLFVLYTALLREGMAVREPKGGHWDSVSSDPVGVDARGFPVRINPVRVAPGGDLASLVPEDGLQLALSVTIPNWHPPTIAMMLHALRLWGPQAAVVVSGTRNGAGTTRAPLLDILLDNDRVLAFVRHEFDAFLVSSPYGIRITTSIDLTYGSRTGEGHCDQILKSLGEAGVPSSTLVRANDRIGTVGDIVRDAVSRFTIGQELEFTGCAFSYWLPPRKSWRDRFGTMWTFDQLANRLVDRPLGEGTCDGCHVPYALVTILCAHNPFDLLEDSTARVMRERLRAIARQLEAAQLPDGGWDKRWSGKYDPRTRNPFLEWKPHFDRISATGHHLEWIAMAPPDLRPNRRCIERAVGRLVRDIARLDARDIAEFKGYLPLTHAARALVLLRAANVNDVWNARRQDARTFGEVDSGPAHQNAAKALDANRVGRAAPDGDIEPP